MNKNVLIGLVLILAAAGGYYQFSVKPAQEAAAAAAAEAEAAAVAAAEAAAAEAKAAEEAAAKAAEEAAAKAAEEAAAAAAAAEAAAAATTEAATDGMAEAMAVLDPAAFDAAKVIGLIDASPLDDATKATLKAGVEAAASNPTMVEGAVNAVETALGM